MVQIPERPKVAALGVLEIRRRGGIYPLAAKLGLTPQAVYQWKVVPAEWVAKVAAATGIPRHILRPDLYREPKP
jgi:DNA-binding transcriptional regulator YdaS (Cro superfamily)